MSTSANILFARLISEQSKERLIKAGLRAEDHEFVQVDYIGTSAMIDEINQLGSPLVFTSKHSVLSIYQAEQESGNRILNRHCYSISPATMLVADGCGFTSLGGANNSLNLAIKIAEEKESNVIHPTAKIRREELYKTLEKGGVKITSFETYEKRLESKKIVDFDAVAFFSPSQIDAFFEANDLTNEQVTFCIGQTTADYIAKRVTNKIIVPSISSEKEMVEVIIQYINDNE